MAQLRIQILATGDFFVLSTDGSLTVQINSTLFNNQGDFLTSKSFPGTAPLDPNKAKIRNAHLMLTDASLRTFKVRAWLGALPWKVCDFRFTIANGAISYVLLLDATMLAADLKTRTMNHLSDININDQMAFANPNAFKAFMIATTTAPPGTYPCVFFPFKNDGAYIDAAYADAPDAYSALVSYGVGVQFLYTNNHIYEVTIATSAGMTPFTDPDRFDDITTYPDVVIPVSKYFNAWQIDNTGAGTFLIDASFPIKHTVVPAFLLTYVLKRIARFYGYEPVGKWLQQERSNRIVIQGLVAVDLLTILPEYYYFMPGIGINEFLTTVREAFGLLIDFDDYTKTCVIDSLDDMVDSPEPVDLRSRQTTAFNETGAVPDAIIITQQPDDKDAAYTEAEKASMPTLTIGTPSTAAQTSTIQLASVPTKMNTEANPDDVAAALWKTPWMKQPIHGPVPLDQVSSLKFADKYNFKLRFLFYYGLQLNDVGYPYPYAAFDAFDNGSGQLSALTLDAASNVYLPVRNFYQYQKNSKPVEIEFMMTAKELMDIRVNKRVLVNDFNFACVSCLIDQVTAGVGPDKDLIPAKLILYPRVMNDNQQQVLQPVTGTDTPPVDNGLVYLRFTEGGHTTTEETHPTSAIIVTEPISVSFWEDEAGTIPKSVTDLPVRLRTVQTTVYPDIDPTTYTTDYTHNYSGTDAVLNANAPIAENMTDGSGMSYSWVYSILTSGFYTIIS